MYYGQATDLFRDIIREIKSVERSELPEEERSRKIAKLKAQASQIIDQAEKERIESSAYENDDEDISSICEYLVNSVGNIKSVAHVNIRSEITGGLYAKLDIRKFCPCAAYIIAVFALFKKQGLAEEVFVELFEDGGEIILKISLEGCKSAIMESDYFSKALGLYNSFCDKSGMPRNIMSDSAHTSMEFRLEASSAEDIERVFTKDGALYAVMFYYCKEIFDSILFDE